MLRAHGEERRALPGDVLFRVGDGTYPFIAIVEGEAAVLDPNGDEVVRHGAHGFLGELNLLSGPTVDLTAVVTQPMRYIAVERDALRTLLLEDALLGDVVLSAFVRRREVLQRLDGIGIEILGPHHSGTTRGSARLHHPSAGAISRAPGIGPELAQREEVDLLVLDGGPRRPRRRGVRRVEGLDTLVVEGTALGGQAPISRRIENLLGFPAGISGAEPTSRAITQARKFGARTATPARSSPSCTPAATCARRCRLPRPLRRRGARPQRDRRAARRRRPARGGHAARRRPPAGPLRVPLPRRRAVHGLAR